MKHVGEHIAQKLHGASEPGSNRAHDLIDLQIIAMKDEIDLKQVKRICERLFAYRKQQPWPPVIEKGTNWDELYMKQRGSLDILESPDDAVAWANDFITQINGSY